MAKSPGSLITASAISNYRFSEDPGTVTTANRGLKSTIGLFGRFGDGSVSQSVITVGKLVF